MSSDASRIIPQQIPCLGGQGTTRTTAQIPLVDIPTRVTSQACAILPRITYPSFFAGIWNRLLPPICPQHPAAAGAAAAAVVVPVAAVVLQDAGFDVELVVLEALLCVGSGRASSVWLRLRPPLIPVHVIPALTDESRINIVVVVEIVHR